MTKFKWVGMNNSKCLDLVMTGAVTAQTVLNNGDVIEIKDTEANERIIANLKSPTEPLFELVNTSKKTVKKTETKGDK